MLKFIKKSIKSKNSFWTMFFYQKTQNNNNNPKDLYKHVATFKKTQNNFLKKI